MRRARAPIIPIESWLAALIFIEVGVRWDVLRPSSCKSDLPARHDWQPVSAIANVVILLVGFFKFSIPRSFASDGRAWTFISTVGCGADALLLQLPVTGS